jgi:putative membrane protein
MKKICTGALLTAAFILISSTTYAGDPAAAGTTVSSRDTEFVQTICDNSLMVKRIGELANQRSQNMRISQIGQKLALDYDKTRLQFSAAAQTMGVPITTELSARALRTVEKLQSLPGMDFDKATLHELVKSEQFVLLKLQDESAYGDNPALKQLAASSLPPLQNDIYQVVILESDLRTTASAATGTSGKGLASEP